MRKNSKSLIIQKALVLFARYGYERTSISAIAKEADISQGLLYNYFKSKDELLLEIINQGLSDIKTSFKFDNEGLLDMENYINTVFEIIKKNQAFWKLFYGLRMQPYILQLLDKEINEITNYILQIFENYFRYKGLSSPNAEARLLFAMIDGACIHYTFAMKNYPVELIKDTIIKRHKSL